MVFQELIPKACERRVAWVAGKISQVRWTRVVRRAGIPTGGAPPLTNADGEGPTSRGSFSGLEALMSELGLVSGAADLICTPGGEHAFSKLTPPANGVCSNVTWPSHFGSSRHALLEEKKAQGSRQ